MGKDCTRYKNILLYFSRVTKIDETIFFNDFDFNFIDFESN